MSAAKRKSPVSGLFVLTLLASVGLFIFVLALAAFVTRDSRPRGSVAQRAAPDAGPAPAEVVLATLADDVVLSALAPRRENLARCFSDALITDPSAPSQVRLVLTMVVGEGGVSVEAVDGLAGLSFGLKRCLQGVLLDARAEDRSGERGTRAVRVKRTGTTVEVEVLGER